MPVTLSFHLFKGTQCFLMFVSPILSLSSSSLPLPTLNYMLWTNLRLIIYCAYGSISSIFISVNLLWVEPFTFVFDLYFPSFCLLLSLTQHISSYYLSILLALNRIYNCFFLSLSLSRCLLWCCILSQPPSIHPSTDWLFHLITCVQSMFSLIRVFLSLSLSRTNRNPPLT